MEAKAIARCQSGDTCACTGLYEFDGYIDGSDQPPPRGDELCVPVLAGDVYPRIESAGRLCYWRLTESPSSPDTSPAPPQSRTDRWGM